MLEQLIESKTNQKENRGGYLLTTFVLVVGLCFSAVLWSLFAKDLRAGNEGFEMSTLVAPIVENAPAPVQKQERQEQTPQTKSAVISRQTNTMRIEESQNAPDKISIVPNTRKPRPNASFLVRDGLETDFQSSSSNIRGSENGGSGIGIEDSQPAQIKNNDAIKPPPPIKNTPAEVIQKTKPVIQSLGVINGKAKFLPKPTYTAAAKAVRASGDVNVQVLIDEAGNVVSANAVTGHPLLKQEAERAARNAKFNPTFLSKQPVKVTGVIVYKFSMQ